MVDSWLRVGQRGFVRDGWERWLCRNRQQRGVNGDARLLGTTAVVLEDFDGEGGWVRVLGEAWRATAEQPLKKGEPVRIVKRTGLQLFVRPAALGDRRG
ncbi:MAG: NfeD family protein [Gammaproteobacteria bacterium]